MSSSPNQPNQPQPSQPQPSQPQASGTGSAVPISTLSRLYQSQFDQRFAADPLQMMRRQFIRALAILALFLGGLNISGRIIVTGELSNYDTILSALIILAGVSSLWLVQRNRLVLAAGMLISFMLVVFLVVQLPPNILIMMVFTLISAAALLPTFWYLLVNAVVMTKITLVILNAFLIYGVNLSQDLPVYNSLMLLIVAVAVSLTTRFFINIADRTAREANRTAILLQATAQIGQLTANLLRQDELFKRAVDLILDRFVFYHVQIFLVDEDRKYARLVASTGDVGERLLARGHRVAVGSPSVIGRVTQIGEIVIARDTTNDPYYAVNELLPNTRSELALPIIDGDRIIGALDVQNARRDAFGPNDIQALQVLANQLATAARNARLFEQQEASVQLNQRLLFEARTNLREIQRLNAQLSKRAWSEYLEVKDEVTGVQFEQQIMEAGVEWTPTMVEAADQQRPITQTSADGKRITAIPIMLRGEVLGAIEIADAEMREADMVEMVQAVAQNLAVSLDSARLFEEAQDTATQEQRLNAIVERFQSAMTVDELLKITVEELSQTLGAETSTIRLGVMPKGESTPTTAISSAIRENADFKRAAQRYNDRLNTVDVENAAALTSLNSTSQNTNGSGENHV